MNQLTNQYLTQKHWLITGASSGIGAALANSLAREGVRLSLVGRNLARLQAVAEACQVKGATVAIGHVDVTEREEFARWIDQQNKICLIDGIIANAGIAIGMQGGTENPAHTQEIFDTNLQGVLNTVLPLWNHFLARKQGTIVLVSSIAGFRGLPNAPAYSASKVAVRALGEAWRAHLKPHGIHVNVVCPGFVHSGITAKNHFPMPGIISAEKAAQLIIAGIASNRAIITFPWWMAWPAWVMACLPVDWVDAILTKLPRK